MTGKAPGFAQGTVGAGCDEYTLYDPDMYAELICDETGTHVDPDMLKMVVRTKGVERIILITDSMPADGDYKKTKPTVPPGARISITTTRGIWPAAI